MAAAALEDPTADSSEVSGFDELFGGLTRRESLPVRLRSNVASTCASSIMEVASTVSIDGRLNWILKGKVSVLSDRDRLDIPSKRKYQASRPWVNKIVLAWD
jgi:hypothetical protein